MSKLSKIDASLIIIILTAYSYALAYSYQKSFNDYYHLPPIFIDVNITTMIGPLLISFVYSLSLFIYGFILYPILEILIADLRKKFQSLIMISAVLLGMGLSLFVVGNAGEFKADVKTDYPVIRQEEKLFIVVASYKDSIIIAPLDLEKESMTPKFIVMEMKELKDVEMVYFKKGLHVEDIKNSQGKETHKPVSRYYEFWKKWWMFAKDFFRY
ncbi:hypothetical protein [Peribacillus frigoritolerans]|uniref:hypothetical protein n=1 Tax=Peribacillus frigoritolerans TaxID=450367 RepID=UPI001F4F398C|nr:hypothetical protein [Peribacillus frigoritolerans]MCK2018846.1 hypothetical protein [Peribacillus frigoritolerans]